MTQKKSNPTFTHSILTKFDSFGKIFSTVRDVTLFAAAITIAVYAYLSAPDREAIRSFGAKVVAVDNALTIHQQESKEMMNKVVGGFDKLNTQLNSINGRLSRIEGKLEK